MPNTSSISVAYGSLITVTETFTGFTAPNNEDITVSGINESGTLTATTTPPATLQTQFNQALTAGAATIDLTALPGLNADEVVNGNGLKVQLVKFKNPSANANKITISQGASNAYRLDGATNWTISLAPGQSAGPFYLDAASDVISSTHKTIDLAGTGTQTLQVAVVMG